MRISLRENWISAIGFIAIFGMIYVASPEPRAPYVAPPLDIESSADVMGMWVATTSATGIIAGTSMTCISFGSGSAIYIAPNSGAAE